MTNGEDRQYPVRPFLAASVAVFRYGHVLLARRTRGPGAGKLALPGGLVEVGETMAQAALRELTEETGVVAEVTGFNTHNEVIVRDNAGKVHAHYAIASFVGVWRSGDGQTGPEAGEIVWASANEWQSLDLVDGLRDILDRAWQMQGGAG